MVNCLQTTDEYLRLLGHKIGSSSNKRLPIIKMPVYTSKGDGSSLPNEVDWRSAGVVGPVMAQVWIFITISTRAL